MRYDELTLETFLTYAKQKGNPVRVVISKQGWEGEEHWRLFGNSVVSWWPWSRRRTAFVEATGRTYYHPEIDKVLILTTHKVETKSNKQAPVIRQDVKCGECGSPMVLKRSKFKNGVFYSCSKYPACKGSHGCHPDGSPLGVPANQETKNARIAAHDAFDQLWKSGGMKRKDAYRWLRQKLTLSKSQCHIGSFDIEMCQKVIQVCNEKSNDRIQR